MSTRPRCASSHDLEAAASTLSLAFEHYPWTRHVIPEDDYLERLRALQLLYLRYAHTHGIVAVIGNSAGVIALLPPGAPEPEAEMLERIVELHGDRVERIDPSEPPADAWILETLGVRPDHQGRGLASELLQFAVTEVARRGGEHIVLDTSDPRNVRLYEHHGFHTTAHADTAGRPPVWKMSTTIDDRRRGRRDQENPPWRPLPQL